MSTDTIHLTGVAIKACKDQLAARKTPGARIRVGVKGGACSGYSLSMQFEDNPPKVDDLELDYYLLRVLVDPKSFALLKGSTIDYKKSLMESGFELESPAIKSKCSCGRSFSTN